MKLMINECLLIRTTSPGYNFQYNAHIDGTRSKSSKDIDLRGAREERRVREQVK